MNPSRRPLLATLALLPLAALPAFAQKKTRAPTPKEPAPPPMPKDEVLAKVKYTIAWANGKVFSAKLSRGNSGHDYEFLKKTESELMEKRKELRTLAASDAQRLRIDEWYLSVKAALYDGAAVVVRTMESESDRMLLAFEDD